MAAATLKIWTGRKDNIHMNNFVVRCIYTFIRGLYIVIIISLLAKEYGEDRRRINHGGRLDRSVWEKPVGPAAQSDSPPGWGKPLHPVPRLPAQPQPAHRTSPPAGDSSQLTLNAR